MKISSFLTKKFANLVKKDTSKSDPLQTMGTAIVNGNETYVMIDGGDSLTPVSSTSTVSNGDRVLVTIQDRQATIIGNYTDPSISNALDSVVVEYALSSSITSFVAWPGEKGQWSTTAPTKENGSYMWQRTTSTPVNGTPTVTMTCIQGADGEEGSPGRGISSTEVKYTKSTNGTSAPSTGWDTTIPSTVAGEYLWTWTRFIYSSGTPAYSDVYTVAAHGATGSKGTTGTGITSLTEQWARGTDSAADSSSWSTQQPTLTTEYPVLWYRIMIVWSNPTSTTYSPSAAGQKSTVVNELVTFRNLIANSGYTTINGSKIGAGTITLGGTANGNGLLEVKDASDNLVAKLSKDENIFAGFKVKAGHGILGFGDTGDLQQSYWSLGHDTYAFTYYFTQVPSIQFARYTYGSEKFFDSFEGWYMSNNKGYASTAAIDVIKLNLSQKTHIYMDIVDCSNEGSYDYGTVGTIDGSALDESSTYSSTGTNVKWTGYNNHVEGGETIDFGEVAAGSHTIWIRYKKDSSTNNENDRLYFRLYAGKEDALYYEDDNGSLMYLSKTRLYQRKIEATYDSPSSPSTVSYSCYKTLIRNACTEVESSESDYVSISAYEKPLSKSIAQTYLYGGSIDFAVDDMSTPLTYCGEEDTINIGSKLAIEGHTDPIGTIKTIVGGVDYNTDVSTTADTGETIATLPILEEGTWLIVARVRFRPTSSGSHTSYITISSTAASTGSMDGRYGTSSNANQHNMSVIVSPTEDTTYYLSGHAGVAGKWLRGSSGELRVVMLRIV